MTKFKEFKKVKALYEDYKLDFSQDMAGDRGKYGECSYRTQQILIDKGCTQNQLASVIIHELLHATMQNIDCKLNVEGTVEKYAVAFCTMIKDNKDLFKTIIEEI